MLQSILFFVLGFLCSGFLALMVAPAIWQRAVALTRKRIEASLPLGLDEIQADKDRMRAELAMTIRRLEMTVKSLREKSAAQAVEIGRSREELKRLAREMDERGHGLSQSEAKAGELDSEVGNLRQQLAELAGKLAEAEKALDEKSAELGRVARLYDETSFTASSRQIELVARQSEVETLSGEMAVLSAARQEAERRHRELIAENRGAQDALGELRRRADDLEEKNSRLAAALDERAPTLERRDEQTARLPARPNGAGEEIPDGAAPAGQADGAAADVLRETPEASAERKRLQGRLAAMIGERGGRRKNRVASRAGSAGAAGRQDAMLRKQMSDLAAEVIRLTARLDGPDSPIARALSAPGPVEAGDAPSLADRVRALQRATSPK